MGGKGSGRRKIVKSKSTIPTFLLPKPKPRSPIVIDKPVKVISLPPASYRELPPLSKSKRRQLKEKPEPLPEKTKVRMIPPEKVREVLESLSLAPESEEEPVLKPEPEEKHISSPEPEPELKVPVKVLPHNIKKLVIAPPPTMSLEDAKNYREYCYSIVDKAEKSNLTKELMLLLTAFRSMFQKQIYKAMEEESTPSPSQKDQHYSEGSE